MIVNVDLDLDLIDINIVIVINIVIDDQFPTSQKLDGGMISLVM